MTASAHLQLLHAIYEAGTAAEQDRVAIEIGEPLRTPAIHAFLLGPTGALETVEVTHTEVRSDEYAEHWREQDPRFALSLARPNQVLSDVELIEPRDFERTALFNEFLRRVDIRYSLMATSPMGDGLMLAHAFMRPPSDVPFDSADKAHLARYLPHLVRAARLRHMVSTLRAQEGELESSLDQASRALVLLDASSRVVFANERARRALAGEHGLRIEGGKLRAHEAASNRLLSAAVARAVVFADQATRTRDDTEPGDWVSVKRARTTALTVHVGPLRPRHPLRSLDVAARALLTLHDPEEGLRLDPTQIAARFTLTPAEAAIACGLAQGASLADIARARGTTEMTARSHLKRVFEKMGVNRQADVVRRLAGLASR